MTAIEQPDPMNDFIDFYKTTGERTFSRAYRAAGRDEHVARDATQEAYCLMWEKHWNDGKKPKDPGSYVVGIAVRKVYDFYRSMKRNPCVPLEGEHDCGSDEPGYDEMLNSGEVLNAVRNLLDRQPARRRAVGVLYFLEEFDYAEIAEVLGISGSTVRTQVERLREKLQSLINRIIWDDQGGEQS